MLQPTTGPDVSYMAVFRYTVQWSNSISLWCVGMSCYTSVHLSFHQSFGLSIHNIFRHYLHSAWWEWTEIRHGVVQWWSSKLKNFNHAILIWVKFYIENTNLRLLVVLFRTIRVIIHVFIPIVLSSQAALSPSLAFVRAFVIDSLKMPWTRKCYLWLWPISISW